MASLGPVTESPTVNTVLAAAAAIGVSALTAAAASTEVVAALANARLVCSPSVVLTSVESTALDGSATVATVRGHGEKVFVAVHGDTPRGVRVRLEGAPWDEWIVGCADPEAVAATVTPAS